MHQMDALLILMITCFVCGYLANTLFEIIGYSLTNTILDFDFRYWIWRVECFCKKMTHHDSTDI